jgi:glyoxylase-like metal-dependent hydrolase (beta-lactamase superfamily II)
LVRHSSGNVLVDTPRYTPRLRHELGRLGGVTLIALTHRDEVGDTERYASEFGSEVLIHEADADAAPFATRILRGADVAHVTSSMVAIPTPGHTEGHLMFLTDDEMLFTGDSLAWDPHTEDLCADRFFCWYSWPEQLSSLARLADHRFVRVIPTHGALSPTLPPDDMRRRLQTLLATHRVTTQPAQPNQYRPPMTPARRDCHDPQL